MRILNSIFGNALRGFPTFWDYSNSGVLNLNSKSTSCTSLTILFCCRWKLLKYLKSLKRRQRSWQKTKSRRWTWWGGWRIKKSRSMQVSSLSFDIKGSDVTKVISFYMSETFESLHWPVWIINLSQISRPEFCLYQLQP